MAIWHGAAAIACVYLFGFVSGSLLVPSDSEGDTVPWSIIRTVTGLLLTSVAFLLSLIVSVPWWVGPALVICAAVAVRRGGALAWRPVRVRSSLSSTAGVVLATLVVAYIPVSAFRMASGPFPPVFYTADTPYFLEKVHALVRATTYPPPSLSNAGGRPPYHYAAHAVAALISRASGLTAHHSFFVLVLPLLTAAIVSSALVIARSIGAAVPAFLAIPVILVPVPSFWHAFSGSIGQALWDTASRLDLAPLRGVEDYEQWGVTSIVGHNVAAQFVVLATIAALSRARAEQRGWPLAVFLAGTAILVKLQTGVALMAGFVFVQAYEALKERQWKPLVPAAGACVVCAVSASLFFAAASGAPAFGVQVSPLFHVNRLRENATLGNFAGDLLIAALPALLVWLGARRVAPDTARPWLLFAVAPFLVVNLTRVVDVRAGGGGASDDWLQVLSPEPLLLHVWVLAFLAERWPQLSRGYRAVALTALAVTVLPSAIVAGRYASILVARPQDGHEFVDNRSIAEALATIPTHGTMIVTNDLRYPAQHFSREDRQMQIPALFGHQAFAVNYRYERYDFSEERHLLQRLLQQPRWSGEVEEAARKFGWTHLLIRKDYQHPEAIPLRRGFENESYVVFEFSNAVSTGRVVGPP